MCYKHITAIMIKEGCSARCWVCSKQLTHPNTAWFFNMRAKTYEGKKKKVSSIVEVYKFYCNKACYKQDTSLLSPHSDAPDRIPDGFVYPNVRYISN